MQALKVLSDRGWPVKLLLIGGRTGTSDPTNAEYAAQVERLIESLGVKERVIPTGYLAPPDVSRALHLCDVMVLPYVDGASLRRGRSSEKCSSYAAAPMRCTSRVLNGA